MVVWWTCGGGGGFVTDYNTTPTKVVLSSFGLLVGLWQQEIGKTLIYIKLYFNLRFGLIWHWCQYKIMYNRFAVSST